MPTYQYRCEKCGTKFERTETIAEHEALKLKCPKCGSKKVSFVPGNCLRGDLQEELTKRALPLLDVGIKSILGYSVLLRNENRHLQRQQRQ
jgi:putative FmdB family regulatory protein